MSKARDLADFVAAGGQLADGQISESEINDLGTTIVLDSDIGSTVLAYDSNLQGFVDALTLPTSDGSDGQALVTNGSGTVSFADAGISTGKAIAMAIVFG